MSTNVDMSLKDRTDPPRQVTPDPPGPVIDIRYGEVGLLQVRIHTTSPGAILDELTGRVAAAPHFFKRTAACLDLGALEKMPETAELRAVIDAVRRVGMLSVGLSGDSAALETLSKAVDLPILSSFRTPHRPVPVMQPAQDAPVVHAPPRLAGEFATAFDSAPAPEPASPAASARGPEPATSAVSAPTPELASSPEPARADASIPALIHGQTIRSGQRLYARNRDLIVTAGVGAGAEVMADGCLHIYGSMRGRAMAGVHGELGARVFCQEFYAELVSIAGVFRVFETIPAELAGKPVQAWLAGETLHFARIGT
ncbi:MAG: septum site-determining protein MinC [Pseudomonadota bacterium]|nr:septum site-determining protein MinC [Pseudomonadota bacterium]